MHKAAKDVRRAFEHLGRIESLQPSLNSAAKSDVSSLVSLAQQELSRDDAGNAADLLRAAEHLGFASLAAHHSTQAKMSSTVLHAIEQEYEHLTRKASEHWSDHEARHSIVKSLFQHTSKEAQRAFASKNYRQALELIRAADALAHVIRHGHEELTSGRSPLSLAGEG